MRGEGLLDGHEGVSHALVLALPRTHHAGSLRKATSFPSLIPSLLPCKQDALPSVSSCTLSKTIYVSQISKGPKKRNWPYNLSILVHQAPPLPSPGLGSRTHLGAGPSGGAGDSGCFGLLQRIRLSRTLTLFQWERSR